MAISKVIRRTNSITKLNLRIANATVEKNSIADAGAVEIARALEMNSSIVRFNISKRWATRSEELPGE